MWDIWAKLIVAKGFKKLPKVQKIAQSGHTGPRRQIYEPLKKIIILAKFWLLYLKCVYAVQW